MIASLCSTYSISSWDSTPTHPAGASLPEKLPVELLRKILLFVTLPANRTNRKVLMPKDPNASVDKEELSLLSVLLTSQKLYHTAVPIPYQSPHLRSPTQFDTFVNQIIRNPSRGDFIRRLDLIRLAPPRNVTGPWSTTNPLFELLSRTPLLRELCINQYLGNDIDQSVLKLILCKLEFLETLKFDSCNSPSVQKAFAGVFSVERKDVCISLAKLSLRNCAVITEDIFELFLSRPPRLRDLDVSGTQITVEALRGLAGCVRLESLNLSHCTNISGKEVAEFLTSHPAISQTLVSSSLAENPEARVLDEDDLATVILGLPTTIRYLNLNGTKFSSSHAFALRKHVENLEYLSVGSQVQMRDLEKLFFSPKGEWDEGEPENSNAIGFQQEITKLEYKSVLSPMEKAVAVCKVRRRINSFSHECRQQHKLKYLNISSISMQEQSRIQCSLLLSPILKDMEVIEISNLIPMWNETLGDVCSAVGWRLKGVGRRCWLERR